MRQLPIIAALILATACVPPNSVHPLRDMGPGHDAATGNHDMGFASPDLEVSCQGTLCQGQCTNPLTDNANCGSCGNACAQDESCQSGVCQGGQCGGQAVLCNGRCTDLSSDSSNCGACNVFCPNAETCGAGVCGGGGQTGCNGLIQCMGTCMDDTCFNQCQANSTPQAQNLLQAIYSCLDNACPMQNGGVCDMTAMGYDQTKCDDCVNTSTQPNGQCGPAITACMNDLP